MMRKLHVGVVIDRSGSMAGLRDQVVGRVNRYLGRLRADPTVAARLSIVMFGSDGIDAVRDRLPAPECPDLTLDEYRPRGETPLRDAVAYSAGLLDCLSASDERRVMAILTDGCDNASREVTPEALRSLFDRKRRMEGWRFVDLRAGQGRGLSGLGLRARSVYRVGPTAGLPI